MWSHLIRVKDTYKGEGGRSCCRSGWNRVKKVRILVIGSGVLLSIEESDTGCGEGLLIFYPYMRPLHVQLGNDANIQV